MGKLLIVDVYKRQVYISTRKSVKKASRVSPIEAIRYVEQDMVSIKRKKTASGSVIPRMAKANLQMCIRDRLYIALRRLAREINGFSYTDYSGWRCPDGSSTTLPPGN